MNEHEDLERILSRYRPLSPPVSLRMRVLGRRLTGQAIVLRAFLGLAAGIAAVWLHTTASRTLEEIASPTAAAADAERQAALEAMTSALGGGDLASDAARTWLREAESRPDPAPRGLPNLESTWFRW